MQQHSFRPFFLSALLTLPGVVLRLGGIEVSPPVVALLSGLAILGASFLLTWACETAQMDIPQAIAVAVVAFIAVLPEYAVDMYFTWMAGKHPESAYSHYAIANMTGANRLLIGLGWSSLVLVFALRFHTAVTLKEDKRTDVLFLGMATIYAMFIPIKGSLTWFDAVVFLGIYGWYIWLASRRPVEESAPEGPAAALAALPRRRRMAVVYGIFAFSALVILCNAEPFSESLVATGKMYGIDEFLLVQWLAPIASEAPEFIIALMFAFRGDPGLALGSLLSSKLNQWTLLVGMIPCAYGLSAGTLAHSIPLDPHQLQEILLTAAQSVFAVVLLLNLRLSLREAFWLLLLFTAQLLAPIYETRLEQALGLVRDPLRLHGIFSWIYLTLGCLLLIRNRSHVPQLLDGFKPAKAERPC
ncbi:MAG: sodium:calcium antiporter [Desulfovibrio sp.]|jgi:cation:H+ antiporter|nr:sodium:calcium antiporter [Desulfovibrio sp.]